MAIANNNVEKPLIFLHFKELCNGEQWLAAQQTVQNFCVHCFRFWN